MTKTLLGFCLAGCLVLGVVSARAQLVNPKAVSTPSPAYPDALTDTGLSGQAEVDITIKSDGTVVDPELGMATHRAFGKAAMAVVKTWQFQPATRDGTAIEMRVTIPFIFAAPLDQQVNAIVKRKAYVKIIDPVLSQQDYGAKLKIKKDFVAIYPRTVTGQRTDETVQVNFIVAPDGTTLNPTIVGTPRKEFELNALVAVARATYNPPLKDGKGVYVEATTKLDFTDVRAERGGGRSSGGGSSGGGRGGGGGGRGGGGGMGGGGM